LRVITEADPCPKCASKITLKHSIELGHTFKLGTKYSEKLGANFLDENGKEKTIIMGCYGIGINRILASLIESSHDEFGIKWPVSLSPFEAVVMPLKTNDEEVVAEAERIYRGLKDAGVDVIIDDREKSAGVKFKDAELIGFPYQVVIGKKSLEEGKIEVKDRQSGEKAFVEKDSIVEYVTDKVS